MSASDGIDLPQEAGVVHYLVSDASDVDRIATAVEEWCDESPEIQARMQLSSCTGLDAYDSVLRTAKVGSRWGKDLDELYYDALDSYLEQVDAESAVDSIVDWYDDKGADAYEAAVTSEAVSIGIGVVDAIREQLDDWAGIEFNADDLEAAAGFAQSQEEWERTGCLVLEAESGLSEQTASNSLGQLVQIVQQFRRLGFRVVVVTPKAQTDERAVINDIFERLGDLTIIDETDTAIEISDDVRAFVDNWYEQLCYDVHDRKISERVARSASFALYDLAGDDRARHFVAAIEDGLQRKYSEKKYDKDTFLEIWRERITSHPNYDKYRSRHTEFPTVTVAREDGLTREFRLDHAGPRTQQHLNGIPLESETPEADLVALIERFLDAEAVDEEQWMELRQTAESLVGAYTDGDIEGILRDALLYRETKTATLTPLVGPPPESTGSDESDETTYGTDFYYEEDRWAAILSGPDISSQFGTTIIGEKQNLMKQLQGTSVADSVLYHKLERDIQNAWRIYLERVQNSIRRHLPSEFEVECKTGERADRTQVITSVTAPTGEQVETTVDIYLPYADVRVEGTPVKRATVAQTASAILDTFGGILPTHAGQEPDHSVDTAELLYDVIRFYIDVTECEPGDRIYFDDLIAFCRLLPGIPERLDRLGRGPEPALREAFGDENLISRLYDDGVKFHRKGSDNHGSIRTDENRYTAFDVGENLI